MPGRDYTKAYARLEQSLGDTSYPAYPSSANHVYRVPKPTIPHPKSFAERSGLTRARRGNTNSPRVETHLLPPTPPPGTQSPDPSFGLANRLTTPELTPDTRQGTPFTTLEAPTPNTTPPSPSGYLASKHIRGLSLESSRADSFRTAQENASPYSENTSPIELPLQGVRKFGTYPEPRLELYALGLKSFDRVTETAHRRFLQDLDLKRASKEEIETIHSIESSKPSTGSMRKRRKVDKAPKELTFLEDAGGLSLKSPTNQESPSSWLDGSSSGENSPVAGSDGVDDNMHGERLTTPESKIIPSGSESSPVVQASIVDSPPRPNRKLRHMSKNSELRQSPPQSKSARVLGNVDEASHEHPVDQLDKSTTRALDGSINCQIQSPQINSNISSEHASPPRSRSLLSPRAPISLKSKWRRSAPGLPSRDPPGAAIRNGMEVVPEDKPLPESPQPAATFDVGDNAVLSLQRASEHSMAASERSTARLGVERSIERASSRNTGARSSPMSDASEALVRDATAINIYPHHNDSVVVVDHSGPSSNTSQDTHTILSRITSHGTEEPQYELSTPVKDAKRNSHNVESPLTNPRQPPEPPSLTVTAPTPAKQDKVEQVSPVSPNQANSAPAVQRTLSQRAKRYSDSFTSSLSRFNIGSRSKRSSVVVSSLPISPASDSKQDIFGDSFRPTWQSRSVLHEIRPNAQPREGTFAVDGDFKEPAKQSAPAETMPPVSYVSTGAKTRRQSSIRRLLSRKDKNAAQGHIGLSSGNVPEEGNLLHGSSSLRRGLSHSFRQRLQDRNNRKEEQRRQERQEKLRHSIGTRFYVEHGALNSP